MASLPLSSFDVYQRPKAKWYPLKSKPGQEIKTKYRGEIEVRVAFTVKSGSLLDLSNPKKEKLRGSFGQLSQAAHSIGGSLLSLGGKERKGIKKLASSVGNKLKIPSRGHQNKEEKNEDSRFSRHSSGRFSDKFSNGEPGVISEDEDEFRFDDLSHKSSGSSLNLASSQASDSLENFGGGELLHHNSMTRGGMLPNRLAVNSSSNSSINHNRFIKSEVHGSSKGLFQEDSGNDWNQKLFGKQSKVASVENHRQKMAASFHQIVVVGEEMSSLPNTDTSSSGSSLAPKKPGRDLHQYHNKTREELLSLVQSRDVEIRDLKEYIDSLLLRVIENCPTVLQTPERKSKK